MEFKWLFYWKKRFIFYLYWIRLENCSISSTMIAYLSKCLTKMFVIISSRQRQPGQLLATKPSESSTESYILLLNVRWTIQPPKTPLLILLPYWLHSNYPYLNRLVISLIFITNCYSIFKITYIDREFSSTLQEQSISFIFLSTKVYTD